MTSFHLTLMHREALRRLEDARVLAGRGDSAHLLELLGFELLLKLIYEITLKKKPNHRHFYHLIFSALPAGSQEAILEAARTRIGRSELDSNHLAVLETWGKNFIDLRYPHEKYGGLSEAEYLRLGETWVEAGAPLDQAQFRFYPEELFAMVEALKQMAADLEADLRRPA